MYDFPLVSCVHGQRGGWGGLRLIGATLLLLLLIGCTSSTPLPISATSDPFLRSARNLGQSPKVVWEEVDRWTFDDEGSLGAFPQPDGAWEVRDDALMAVSGDKNRTILLRSGITSDIRLEFDVTLDSVSKGRIGDVTILIGATNDDAYFRTGYALTTGSYWNNCSTIYRAGRPLANTEYSPLEEGRTYHVTVVKVGGHLRYWLDHTIVLEAWDHDPLILPGNRWLGIRTWNTRLRVDNIVLHTSTQ